MDGAVTRWGVRAGATGGLLLPVALALAGACGGAQQPAKSALVVEPKGAAGSIAAPVCVPSGAEVCFNARDDNCNGSIDEGCGLMSGLLQFVAAWVESDVDIDLEVTDPDGQLIELRRVSESGLFKERDCPGRDGECRGINLENVVLQSNEPMRRGTYVVRVRLESLADVEDPVRVQVSARLGPKQFAAELEFSEEKEERQFELTL